jgi:hypothetical protein
VKDQFAEIVHKRLCTLPEDVAVRHPVFWVLFISHYESRMHPIWYAKHRLMGLARRLTR